MTNFTWSNIYFLRMDNFIKMNNIKIFHIYYKNKHNLSPFISINIFIFIFFYIFFSIPEEINLTEAIIEAQTAIQYFFNNQFIEAKQIMQPR